MRKIISSAVLVSMLAPGAALAQAPRFYEKGDELCVEAYDGEGYLVEMCRPKPGTQLRQPELGESAPFSGRRWSTDPIATARRHAGDDEGGGGAFGGGFVAGLFLGLVGTAVAGVVASSSNVTPPEPPEEYPQEAKWAYRQAYTNEVQSTRTGSAIAGGVVGTLLLAGAVVGIIVATGSID
ncbi:hypothetical protein [Vulgatibacter sp.]|uniref:hypothetical protein n=1 Tax=Vulgatibacter sp. TaxID=1971226 RepID=UPI0035684BAA